MSTTKIVLCVLGAAAAGVAIGTFLTSEKGAEFTANLRKSAEDWLNNLQQARSGSMASDTHTTRERAGFEAGATTGGTL